MSYNEYGVSRALATQASFSEYRRAGTAAEAARLEENQRAGRGRLPDESLRKKMEQGCDAG
ncbi:MAG: hypothetical protein ACRETD_13935 [Steroidobacteraceae bacterium]